MKIHVTGNSGSGKTTLARELSNALGLPFFSLDSIVWQPGWKKTSPEQRSELEGALLKHEAWVIDGVSERVRKEADVVIYLDIPPIRCWFRTLRRSLMSLTRSRPELPADCPEWRIMFRQIRIIRNFPRHAGLAIEREADLSRIRYRVFAKPVDVNTVLESLIPPNKQVHRTVPTVTPFASAKAAPVVHGR